MIKIKLIKSPIGRPGKHQRTVKALGLTKIGKVVEKQDNPQIRGMVNTISHMVEIVE